MKPEHDKAIKLFRSGYNCAQSVLAAYSEDMKFDAGLALCISCGFGGGMGRLQQTCGAVTGSFMAIGIYNCKKYSDNNERKDKTYAMIRQFNEKFMALHGSTDCKSLLNCDLMSEEGRLFAKQNNLYEMRCEKYISDAVGIIQELTGE
ncbi:MAG TPA: C-GCAxxG-C-C family protein [Bacteroidales bacterium]|nr:C-GCAxxG-C-C family protein [Bacteroidales bacterium]HPT01915.1 C-GCAxxG-C-C family protein [Bacteroidales bacterium]